MIKEGIVLYDIESDNCLNGVYTNEHVSTGGEIFNEIAKLKPKTKTDGDNIAGIYDCFHFDNGNSRENTTLEIELIRTRNYGFKWKDLRGRIIFEGIGYKMNERQIGVHYWSPLSE